MNLLEPNDLFDEKSENDFIESRYDITNAKSFYLVSILVIFIHFYHLIQTIYYNLKDSISAMDCALQLGRSNALMSHTVEANTVLNSMSEKLYSAEREVPITIILYFFITQLWNILLYYIYMHF